MTTAQELIDKVGMGFQEKLNQMEVARQDCINAAANVAPRVSNLEAVHYGTGIFVDEFDGNDANDGGGSDNGIKTYSRLDALWSRAGMSSIRLHGELDIDHYNDIHQPPRTIYIGKTEGSVHDYGQLRLMPSLNVPGASGRFTFFANTALHIENINVILDTPDPGALFGEYLGAFVNVTFANCVFSETARNVGKLIAGVHGVMDVKFVNSPITPIAGSVFEGVPSGANPNNDDRYVVNITSA